MNSSLLLLITTGLIILIGTFCLVLDLYAGSGALGIEAVSRGCDHASLVDINHAACTIIKKNVALTKEEQRFNVYNMRSSAALKLFSENV